MKCCCDQPTVGIFLSFFLSVRWFEGRAGGLAAAVRQQPAGASGTRARAAALQSRAPEAGGQEVTGERVKVKSSGALGIVSLLTHFS